MGGVTDGACGVTAARFAALAKDQGTTLDVMRTLVARNLAAVAATAARMTDMVQNAGIRAVLDRMLERDLGRVCMHPPIPIGTDG